MYDNLLQVSCSFENKAKQLFNGQTAWILVAKKGQRKDEKQLLGELDKIVCTMPAEEIKKLKTRLYRIIPDSATQFIEEYDRTFTDAIVEILGYGWLSKKYPSHTVEFCEPDLVVLDDKGNLVAAMACKKINESQVSKDYFKYHQGEARPLDTRLTSADPNVNVFLKKVKDTIVKAEEQLSHTEACNKFILMDFTFDPLHVVWQRQKVNQLIQAEGDTLRNKGIGLIACENYEIDKPFFCT